MNDNRFCDWCNQNKATAEREGDKVCKTCAKEYDRRQEERERELREIDRLISAAGKVLP